MIGLLLVLVLCLAALGMGGLCARMIGLRSHLRIEALVYVMGLGWVGLSLGILVLGLLGRLHGWLLWVLVVPFALLGVWSLYRPLRTTICRETGGESLDWLDWLVLVPTGLLILVLVLVAMAPASGQDMAHDGLAYHLTIPKLYLEQGRISFEPSMAYSTYPMGMNLLFLPGLVFGQTGFAQLLHLSMGLLTAAAMVALAAHHGDRTVAVLAPAAFLAMPLVLAEATWPMVDLGVTLYTWLALVAVVRWQATESNVWLVISGTMAGFALSIKLTAAFGIVAIGAILVALLIARRPQRPTDCAAVVARFCIPLVLVGSPWYVRNWVLAGNPFMPYLHSVFGSTAWRPQAVARYLSYVRSCGLDLSLGLALASAFVAVAAALVIALGTRLPRVVKILSAYALLWGASWLVGGSPQRRFLLPLYPVAMWLAAWCASAVIRRWAVTRPVLHGAVALGIIVTMTRAVPGWADMFAVGLGLESEESFLDRKVYMYRAYRFTDTGLDSGAKLLVFPENRTFYLNRSYTWGDPIFSDAIDYSRHDSPHDLLRELGAMGVTHVIVLRPAYPLWRTLVDHDRQASAYVEHAFELVDGLVAESAVRVFEANGAEVYALAGPQEVDDG